MQRTSLLVARVLVDHEVAQGERLLVGRDDAQVVSDCARQIMSCPGPGAMWPVATHSRSSSRTFWSGT